MRHLALGLCAVALGCGSGPPGDRTDGGASALERVCGAVYCLELHEPETVPDLGRALGGDRRGSLIYLLGESRSGIIREYEVSGDGALEHTEREIRLRDEFGPIAANPTGLSNRFALTVLGDNTDGVGAIFVLFWDFAIESGDLRTAVISRVVDDLGSDPSGPEIVVLDGMPLVATADRGASGARVRLYNPDALAAVTATSDPGVLVESFESSGGVQSLFAWQGALVLVQNGQGTWQLTFLDLAASIAAGAEVVVDRIELSRQGQLTDVLEVAPGSLELINDGLLDNVVRGDLSAL